MDLPIWEAQFLKLVFWVSGIIQSFNHSIIQSPPCSFPLLSSNTNIWLRIKAKLTQCYIKQSQGWWLLSLSPPFLHHTWKKLHISPRLQYSITIILIRQKDEACGAHQGGPYIQWYKIQVQFNFRIISWAPSACNGQRMFTRLIMSTTEVLIFSLNNP